MILKFQWHIGLLEVIFALVYSTKTANNTTVIRKSNFHDYDFDDWEETTPLLYFDDSNFSTTISTSLATDTEISLQDLTFANTPQDESLSTSVLEPEKPTATTATAFNPDIATTEAESSHLTETTDNMNIEEHNVTDTILTESINNSTDIPETTFTETETTEHSDSPEMTETTSVIPTINATDDEHMIKYYLTTTESEFIVTPPLQIINGSTVTMPTSTVHPLVMEVKSVMNTLKYGYFTALLMTFLRVISAKEDHDLIPIKQAVHNELGSAQAGNKFLIFGPVISSIIQDFSELWAISPPDVIKSQASLFYVSVTNRRGRYNAEVNAVYDVIDNAYLSSDAMNVIACLADIEAFPNTTQSADTIVKNLMTAALFVPYARIRGTTKEKLLLSELDGMINQNLIRPLARRNRRPDKRTLKKPEKRVRKPMTQKILITTKGRNVVKGKFIQTQPKGLEIKKSKKNLRQNGRERQSLIQTNELPLKSDVASVERNHPIRLFDFFTTTELTTTTDVDLDYLRNDTIMVMLKRKMKAYKKKWKRIRDKEQRLGSKRGKTTTTTTTTTTVKPTMHRSKYYMRKYKFSNLYRMKTTTPSTTTKKKWFRKHNEDISDLSLNYSSSECSCSKNNLKSTSGETIKSSNYILDRDTAEEVNIGLASPKKHRKNNKKYDLKLKHKTNVKSKYKDFNENLIENPKESERVRNNLGIVKNSVYSDDENELKANIRDALVHGWEHDLALYKDRRRYNLQMKPLQSESSEETLFKANIYKALGYGNNFAAALKNNIIYKSFLIFHSIVDRFNLYSKYSLKMSTSDTGCLGTAPKNEDG